MYPFSALQLIVIEWHSGRETEALSDSDGEGEGEDVDSSVQGSGTTEPAVRYSSQEDYDRYVVFPHLAHIVRLYHSHPHVSPLPRRIQKIGTHYESLGLGLLFERLPRLEEWLAEDFDKAFVSKVGLHSHLSLPSGASNHPTLYRWGMSQRPDVAPTPMGSRTRSSVTFNRRRMFTACPYSPTWRRRSGDSTATSPLAS